jgi:tRNA (5-methylaminomethyl-2-thiouridylate)-methyltransferase
MSLCLVESPRIESITTSFQIIKFHQIPSSSCFVLSILTMRMMRKGVGANLPHFIALLVLSTRCVGSFITERISILPNHRWQTSTRTTPPFRHTIVPSSLISLQAIAAGDDGLQSTEQPALYVQDSFTGTVEHAFGRVSTPFRDLSVDDIQMLLVRKGADYTTNHQSDGSSEHAPLSLQSAAEKVSGCVANVHVRTILEPISPEHNPSALERTSVSAGSYRVHVQGIADALLSRGLLAILANALQGVSGDQVLDLVPGEIAEKLGVGPALSPGRNDGLASMMRTIQKQIQALVLESLNDENSAAPPLASTEGTPLQRDSTLAVSDQPSVALLLSGGVDSSVALNLLKRQNYTVTAFYLKIWLEDELAHLGQCPWEDDYRVCQQVCEQAGVPLETISLQDAYKERVISYTVKEAEHGRTPNPDIMCNSRIKFGCFYEAIAARDFDFVATGHYAQLVNDTEAGGGMRLLRAPDPVKDQSYFLCALTQEQLQRVLFPIGHLQKSEVRALAEEFELPNRHRPDSQGLCFLGKVKFEEFLGAYLGERPGEIIDAATGDHLGRHRGVWYHTVGQRKGIGKVLDPLATSRGPWYVVAKDPDNDIVFCSNMYDEDMFTAARSSFNVENIQWTAGTPPASVVNGGGRVVMKIRHGPRLVEGTFTLTDESGTEGDVELDKKDSGLAPGQYVVFYNDEECLGGGVISERHWAKFLLDREKDTVEVEAT